MENLLEKEGKRVFITSFYFKDVEKENTYELAKRVKMYNNNPTVCISSDIKYYDIIQQLFPEHCHLFWNVEESNNQDQHILRNPNTKAIILARPT